MTVPITRSSYASTTADEAWEALSRMYTHARPRTSSPDAALTTDTAESPDIAVDRVWLHAAQGAFSESPDQLNVISVLTGQISLDFGRHGNAANLPGDSYVYLPEWPADLDWDTFSALAIRVPLAHVAQAALELTGPSTDALRFLDLRPLSPAHARHWLRTATLLWQHLSAADSLATNPLVHQELITTASAAALSTFPNTAMTRGYTPGPGDTRPAALRRAIAYIDAHASLPITVTDIAHAAGTEPRSLRAAFRSHLDTTPIAYLRRVRLDGAHRDLQNADPTTGTTIRDVATRWGFPDPNRFAATYLAVYGHSPHQTLHS